MTKERYLHVGLHGNPRRAVAHAGACDESDLYGAFVRSAEDAEVAWSRLDVPAPHAIRWGMNDAELTLREPQLAWVQVTPTVQNQERFPLIDVAVALRQAVASIADVTVEGIHSVTSVEEFIVRSEIAVPRDVPCRALGRARNAVVTVDAFTAVPSDLLFTTLVEQQGTSILNVLSAANADRPAALEHSGMWRIYDDPALEATCRPQRYELAVTVHCDDFVHLPAASESVYSALACLEADGPASVAASFAP